MLITPTAPITQPAVANLALKMSTYDFASGGIHVVVAELDANGNELRINQLDFTADQVAAFFSTPVNVGDDLRTVFVKAFLATVQAIYGLTGASATP